MTTSLGSVLVTPEAAYVRRNLGPVAWVVAEALVSRATPDTQGSLVASTGIRRLANELGLDKDTVARALARLKAGGFVARVEQAPAGYVIRSIPGLLALDVLERPGEPSSTLVPRPTKGDSIACPSSGDKLASEPELSAGSTKDWNRVPQNEVPNSLHLTHTTQTNETTPHQQSLFPPSDTDIDDTDKRQSLTAFSDDATANAFSSSSDSSTTTSSPTDSCHLSMADAAGPGVPDRAAARKIGGSSHPTLALVATISCMIASLRT